MPSRQAVLRLGRSQISRARVAGHGSSLSRQGAVQVRSRDVQG